MMTLGGRPARRPLSLLALAVAAAACASAGCASARGAPRSHPTAGPPPVPPSAPVPAAVRIVEAALLLQGAPYRDGGADPSGFDCSGFVQYVFGQAGIALPRSAREQMGAGRAIRADAIASGDLLFFDTNGAAARPGATHVAVALDAFRFIHAPNERSVVRIDSLETAYWRDRLIAARRVR